MHQISKKIVKSEAKNPKSDLNLPFVSKNGFKIHFWLIHNIAQSCQKLAQIGLNWLLISF